MATFYCQCGAPLKKDLIEVERIYMNKRITVYDVPGYKCNQCTYERVPLQESSRISDLIKNTTPDKDGRIKYVKPE